MIAAETNPRRTKMPPVASKSHPAHRNGAHASESIINPPATREPPPIFVTSRSAATLLRRARLHVPNPHRMTTIDNAIQPGRRGLNRYRPVSANKTSNPPTSMNTNSFMTRKRLPGLAMAFRRVRCGRAAKSPACAGDRSSREATWKFCRPHPDPRQFRRKLCGDYPARASPPR
jgi:hypothetical protein